MERLSQSRYTKFISRWETAFKLEFLLFGLLTYNSYTFGRPVMSVFVWISSIMAGVLLVDRLVHYKNYLNNRFLWLLIALMASLVISTVWNYQYGIVKSVKTIVWMGVHFILLFPCDSTKKLQDYKKDFSLMCVLYTVYMFVASLVSLIQLLVKYGQTTYLSDGTLVLSGLVWGRLWGIFRDPNYGSVMACAAIIISIFAIRMLKKRWCTVCLVVNIVLQLLYISFSDSRTGLVCFALTGGFIAYCLFVRAKKWITKAAIKQACSLVLAVGICFVFLFLPGKIKDGYNMIVASEPGSSTEDPSIGREQDLENDISNRRFDLWKSGLEIFASSPVIGVGPDNFIAYSEEHLPNIYLVNNDHGAFDNFHNSYLDILAGQGALGFIIAIVLSVYSAVFILRRLFRIKGQEDYLFCLMIVSILVCALISSMFLKELFYTHSSMSILFWTGLGFCVAFFRREPALSLKNEKDK